MTFRVSDPAVMEMQPPIREQPGASIPRDLHTPCLEPIETRLESSETRLEPRFQLWSRLIRLEESPSEQFQAPRKHN